MHLHIYIYILRQYTAINLANQITVFAVEHPSMIDVLTSNNLNCKHRIPIASHAKLIIIKVPMT